MINLFYSRNLVREVRKKGYTMTRLRPEREVSKRRIKLMNLSHQEPFK